MKPRALSLALGLLLLAGPVAAQPDRYSVQADSEALRRVWLYLADKDCPGAVKALNEGLKGGVPSVWLLAGAMYEDGLCLKQSRERATEMFQQAHAKGHRAGRPRLVAAFGAPGAGQDKAAALWWALEPRLHGLPQGCATVQAYRQEPERFVQALQAWPAQRLDACVHVASVMAALAGEMEFPSIAQNHGLAGTLVVEFNPAAGEIAVRTQDVEQRVSGLALRSGERMRDAASRSVQHSMENHLRTVAERALARHPRPAGIDPTWRLNATYSFDYVY